MIPAVPPVTWTIRAFQCTDPLPGFEAVAHLFGQAHDRRGRTVFSLLPATAIGSSCDEAAKRLRAFLQAEIARETKRRANAEAFGERIRRREARAL